jgi:hypothetical protein
LVTLDFKDRPIAEIASEISARSGNEIDIRNFFDPGNNPRKITLLAEKAIPFWDALDRLSVASKLTASLHDGGGMGPRRPVVSLSGAGGEPGPACYSGPFRFGKLVLDADYSKDFLQARGSLDLAGACDYRAEFQVLTEPRVLALCTGPLGKLVADDDRGGSLLDAKITDPWMIAVPLNSYDLGSFNPTWRVRLTPPANGARRLRSLKGVMPVEAAVIPREPTLNVPLLNSVGKTFKAGDVSLRVESFGPGDNGSTTLHLVARIKGPRGPEGVSPKPVVWARSSVLARLISIVDSQGREAQSTSGSTSPGDELSIQYVFPAPVPGGVLSATPPTHLRFFEPNWVGFDAVFEFTDVALP